MRIVAAFLLLLMPFAAHAQDVTVGSKKFTEGVILGEIATLVARSAGADAIHRREIGGTRVLWEALLRGDLDAYPDYTGTLVQEVLADEAVGSDSALAAALEKRGVRMTRSLGFNNTYALGMREGEAARLGIETLSDLRDHPDLKLGFSNEFIDRADGWRGLKQAYALPHRDVRGIDHDLAYQGLDSGALDVVDLYSTDAEIAYYGLRTLWTTGTFSRATTPCSSTGRISNPAPRRSWKRGKSSKVRLTQRAMGAMNGQAKIDKTPEAVVAAAFVDEALGIRAEVAVPSRAARVWQRTKEHLWLVGWSLAAAMALAIPLGVAAAKIAWLEAPILGAVGVLYTIPEPGAAGVHDSPSRHRRAARDGGAVSLQPPAHRPQHARRADGHRARTRRKRAGRSACLPALGCGASNCRSRRRRFWRASRPLRSSTSARPRWARSSARAATASPS